MLAVAAQRALAYSLFELPLAGADECDGTVPLLGDLADARDADTVPASRLPAPGGSPFSCTGGVASPQLPSRGLSLRTPTGTRWHAVQRQPV